MTYNDPLRRVFCVLRHRNITKLRQLLAAVLGECARAGTVALNKVIDVFIANVVRHEYIGSA